MRINKKRPYLSFYKANFEGAEFQDLQKAGIGGVVIRDSNGEVIDALSESSFLPATVEDVEANACRNRDGHTHWVMDTRSYPIQKFRIIPG